MPRYKLKIEYDGTQYNGWQIQPDAITVQGEIEKAILKFCGEQVELFASGRTDSGVHATGQVAHFDSVKELDAARVLAGVNFHLKPNNIVILEAEQVTEQFHARFSATKRHYKYVINNRPVRLALELNRATWVIDKLDVAKMQEGAKYLVGNHDFTSFRASICQAKSPVKTLEKIEITQREELIEFRLSAKSFLHHMVRNIVGSLVMVGKGKWQPEDIKTALEAKDRSAAGPTAPSDGLYLIGIDY